MDIRHIKQFLLAASDPRIASIGLTLCAMAVTARVIRDGLLAAASALIQMPAQRLRAATLDGAPHAKMLPAPPGSGPLDKAFAAARMMSATSKGGGFISYAACGIASPAPGRTVGVCRAVCPLLSDDALRDASKWKWL